MTSVNDFHERSPRGMFWENFTSQQGMEGVQTKVFREYFISHMENRKKSGDEHGCPTFPAKLSRQVIPNFMKIVVKVFHGEDLCNLQCKIVVEVFHGEDLCNLQCKIVVKVFHGEDLCNLQCKIVVKVFNGEDLCNLQCISIKSLCK